MGWDKKYMDYGVVKIHNTDVWVYSGQYSWETICVGWPIRSVNWAGDSIVVTLEKGDVRRYKDKYSWIKI